MFSGLILGSIAPDLPHLLFLESLSRYGHSLGGVFLVSLPTGFIGLLLFQYWLKRPLLALAPDSIRLRLPLQGKFGTFSVSRLAWVLVSILIGVLTHILWDAFVKSHGLLATNWPHWYCMRDGTLFCRLLMPVSSFGGLAVLGIVSFLWARKTSMFEADVIPPAFTNSGRLLFYLVSALFAIGFGLFDEMFYTPLARGEDAIAAFLFGGMAAAFWIVVIFSTWWHVRRQGFGSEISRISE